MSINQNSKPTLSVQIVNFGCKLNQFEGESLKEALIENGIETKIVHPSNLSHHDNRGMIYIINTCTVTSKSDRKARNAIYKAASLKRDNDILIVTGCYAQTDANELEKIKGVDFVVGNLKKSLIPQIIKTGKDADIDSFIKREKLVFSYRDPIKLDRSRAYVKVQDGCNMNCSYCKVPLARGESISRASNEIIEYLKRLEDIGYREAILTGINLGSYRFGNTGLAELLELIIKNTKNIGIRLSSIEPMYFKDDFFEVLKSDRIMPHFHIPLQSGSNRILRLMRRPYNVRSFEKIVEKLKNIKNQPHLATDIIVGFPTESEEDFKDSFRVIKDLEFSSIHVFTYSSREGTESAKMKDNVSSEEKNRKSQMLIELGKELNFRYRSKFLNRNRNTIFEKHGDTWIGVTDNYIKVIPTDSNINILPKISYRVKIIKVTTRQTFAKVIAKLE